MTQSISIILDGLSFCAEAALFIIVGTLVVVGFIIIIKILLKVAFGLFKVAFFIGITILAVTGVFVGSYYLLNYLF